MNLDKIANFILLAEKNNFKYLNDLEKKRKKEYKNFEIIINNIKKEAEHVIKVINALSLPIKTMQLLPLDNKLEEWPIKLGEMILRIELKKNLKDLGIDSKILPKDINPKIGASKIHIPSENLIIVNLDYKI